MARRGFKTWAEKTASKYRNKLGLDETDPLCAWNLAKHLKIKVWTPEKIPGIPQNVVNVLLSEKKSSWSAATLVSVGTPLIILNSSHYSSRQSNDLMHEISHVILGHKPTRVDFYENNFFLINSYNAEIEEEADILARILLLPRVALVLITKSDMSQEEAIKKYKVSKELLNMALNLSGVNKQFQYRGHHSKNKR